jgi:hypothetical protein
VNVHVSQIQTSIAQEIAILFWNRRHCESNITIYLPPNRLDHLRQKEENRIWSLLYQCKLSIHKAGGHGDIAHLEPMAICMINHDDDMQLFEGLLRF